MLENTTLYQAMLIETEHSTYEVWHAITYLSNKENADKFNNKKKNEKNESYKIILTYILSLINKLEKSEIKAEKYVKKTYFYQYFLALAMIFFMAYFYMSNKE